MSEQQDRQETAQLEQVNDELTRALKLCHSVVDDYRSKLSAKLHELAPANDDSRDGPG